MLKDRHSGQIPVGREVALHCSSQSYQAMHGEWEFHRRSVHAMMVASLVATGLVEPAQALGCVFLQSAFGAYDFENLREEKDLHCISMKCILDRVVSAVLRRS